MNIKKPFFIAEVGVNHEGDIEKAIDMIESAADAGADCVKFQMYKADELAITDSPAYWDTTKEKTKSQHLTCTLKILGSAIFNVTPQKAGIYFNKLDCFCYEENTILPGETISLPVTFFISPSFLNLIEISPAATPKPKVQIAK